MTLRDAPKFIESARLGIGKAVNYGKGYHKPWTR